MERYEKEAHTRHKNLLSLRALGGRQNVLDKMTVCLAPAGQPLWNDTGPKAVANSRETHSHSHREVEDKILSPLPLPNLLSA